MRPATQQSVTDVSVVFGNVVLADQGLTLPPTAAADRCRRSPDFIIRRDPGADRCQPASPDPLPVRYRPTVPDSPLTQAVPLALVALPNVGIPVAPVRCRCRRPDK